MQLTKAEEQIMQILWTLEEATVHDIMKEFVKEKPARTTIATILGILETKEFVTHKTDGRSNVYWAIIKKEDYSKKQLFGFLKNYFDGSFSSMTSFFAKETNLSIDDLDKLLEDTKQSLLEEQHKKDK